MSIDLGQFRQTFIEESLEGLDIMESGLLELDVGDADPEKVHTIFRAAHSIKGGSATFGLGGVSGFTHVMETLLDEVRDGRRTVSQELVDLLLKSVDCLRNMIESVQNDGSDDAPCRESLKTELEGMLEQGGGAVPSAPPAGSPDPGTGSNGGEGWRILFRPEPHLMKTGNDPLRLLRELGDLGELEVAADVSGLPAFDELDPEETRLAWDITLHGDVDRSALDEVFEWVEDDCELTIDALGAPVTPAEGAEAEPAATTQAEAAQPPSAARKESRRSTESASIRVSIDKVDALINMMGELVITQSMLNELGESEEFDAAAIEKLRDGLAELERNTRELQESVMSIRMLPISFAFSRFPRMVRDLSQQLEKKVELELSGEGTELDKTVMEKIGDPLVHLVRNAVDHGIESPERRREAGKPEAGTVHLTAYHQGGNIVIEIRDDGGGLDRDRILAKARERDIVEDGSEMADAEVFDLIFAPGFSTADVVSDVSGRGVGMDVVRRNINSLGGSVEVESEFGQGSTFRVRLPLTLAILDGQSVAVGDEVYIIPLVSIMESIQIREEQVRRLGGEVEVFRLREDYIPIIRLHEVFGIDNDRPLDEGLLVIVEGRGRYVGLFVDDLLGQQQVVIKSLESNFKPVEGFSGATILGDGSVALILDIPGLINYASRMVREGERRESA